MIEVAVSIVIVSVGLLALAAVNAASVRYAKMSQYRATATQLSVDIGERIRANKGDPSSPSGFYAGAYDFTLDLAAQAANATLPAELCNTAAASCSPAQIAALDLAQWRLWVRSQLPQGSVFLQRDEDAAAMDVWIAWREPLRASDDSPSAQRECPSGLNQDPTSIRCQYFRIKP
ncbi:type IV pilus modification protein PilV [Malikia sp.]|uniref:type IV pilus modification protein PilV n=1 Tax=Malikia sp. TaxID=2070706 RepID=UPI002637DB08|nr:type IV pilus modification protein PilV [Malikia sp.]MDD2729222.1 type IV pilus modification protein PilV [Malikia sp.]